MTNKKTDDTSKRPQVRESLIFRPLDEEWVVYDSEGEKLHVLNGSAAVVWLLCNGQLTESEILNEVAEAFDHQIPTEQLEDDVHQAIAEFSAKGLLE